MLDWQVEKQLEILRFVLTAMLELKGQIPVSVYLKIDKI